jgi:hypothetical protein
MANISVQSQALLMLVNVLKVGGQILPGEESAFIVVPKLRKE